MDRFSNANCSRIDRPIKRRVATKESWLPASFPRYPEEGPRLGGGPESSFKALHLSLSGGGGPALPGPALPGPPPRSPSDEEKDWEIHFKEINGSIA